MFISEVCQISNMQQNSPGCGGFCLSFPFSGNWRIDDKCMFHSDMTCTTGLWEI